MKGCGRRSRFSSAGGFCGFQPPKSRESCSSLRYGDSAFWIAPKPEAIPLPPSEWILTRSSAPAELSLASRQQELDVHGTDNRPDTAFMLNLNHFARIAPQQSVTTIRSGVRKVCIRSPILFNYAFDWILGTALHEEYGVDLTPGRWLTDLDYVDDIALLASSFGDLLSMVSRVNGVAKSVGLSINAGKTKVFFSCIPFQEKTRRDSSIVTKIRMYRASVRSVLLFGCECWAIPAEDERKLDAFDHHCLSTILRVQYADFALNETVRTCCENMQGYPKPSKDDSRNGLNTFFVAHLTRSVFLPLIRPHYPIGGVEEGVSSKPCSTQFFQTWKLVLELRYSASVVGERNGLSCLGNIASRVGKMRVISSVGDDDSYGLVNVTPRIDKDYENAPLTTRSSQPASASTFSDLGEIKAHIAQLSVNAANLQLHGFAGPISAETVAVPAFTRVLLPSPNKRETGQPENPFDCSALKADEPFASGTCDGLEVM
ncbi:unnamed protein product [Schistocephalus solidus]|uniref:Reverse transcriptase domain-containing protein n=1 Tax=Schistocephalus solidus TaxID=70667 RepID=A0A183T607_SCHSO|nr:unnamed protein product [Schistocephalus solidus]